MSKDFLKDAAIAFGVFILIVIIFWVGFKSEEFGYYLVFYGMGFLTISPILLLVYKFSHKNKNNTTIESNIIQNHSVRNTIIVLIPLVTNFFLIVESGYLFFERSRVWLDEVRSYLKNYNY
ncbi:hypothetical protein HYU92_01935 [Candidatus Curtissbacteria bacterium]|nr:hypothetical protein [Candidatus Curtissbacteria bacterium]